MIAAAKWGRNSVGFEIDAHYCELARKRISEQILLFGGPQTLFG